jgi:hypothetical protein
MISSISWWPQATDDGSAGSGFSAPKEKKRHMLAEHGQALAESTQCKRRREVAAAVVNGVNQLLSSPNLKANLTAETNRELSGRPYTPCKVDDRIVQTQEQAHRLIYDAKYM